MKRIAIASTVVALAGIGAGSALAGGNTGVQLSNVQQGSQATSAAVNTTHWSGFNVNISSAESANAAQVTQVLKQFNIGF